MTRPILLIYMAAVMIIVIAELYRQDKVLETPLYNRKTLLFEIKYRNTREDRNLWMTYTACTVLFTMYMYKAGYGLADFLLLFVSYAVILLYLINKRDILFVYKEKLVHLGPAVQVYDFDIYNTYRLSYNEKILYLYTDDPLEKPVGIPIDIKTEYLVELNDVISPFVRQMVRR